MALHLAGISYSPACAFKNIYFSLSPTGMPASVKVKSLATDLTDIAYGQITFVMDSLYRSLIN